MLLEFLNIGGAELGIILAILLMPVILIVYCIVNIINSSFKTTIHKPLFLLLVIFAPFVGSIIYLIIRKDYIMPKNNFNQCP